MSSVDSSFSILCVCTGNICRSPAAERLLASQLGPTVEVSSAGTLALVGESISPPMDELIAGAGANPDRFAARRLIESLLKPADLVLALTRGHRGDVAEFWPKAVRRSFTLKEFGRLLGQLDPSELPAGNPAVRLRAAVPIAASRRHHVADLSLDDVIDPYGHPPEVYSEAFADIERAVTTITGVICPSGRPPFDSSGSGG